MKNCFHSLIIFLLFFGCSSSKHIHLVTNDRGEKVAIGDCTSKQLLDNFPQFKKNYISYQPDKTVLDNIKKTNEKIEIITILGTRCSDSRREIPRFIKIMEYLNDNNFHIRFFGVDRTKRDDKGLTDKFELELVPTFIFLVKGQEIGRIIESPQISLEEDILEIMNSVSSFE